MTSTIESTHTKILSKIAAARTTLQTIAEAFSRLSEIYLATGGQSQSAAMKAPAASKASRPVQNRSFIKNIAARITAPAAKLDPPPNFLVGLAKNELDELESKYNLAVTVCLIDYYVDGSGEDKYTAEYYRIITSEGYLTALEDILAKCVYMCDSLTNYNSRIVDSIDDAAAHSSATALLTRLTTAQREIGRAHGVEISKQLEQIDYELCTCGSRMDVEPSLSQLNCPSCGRIDDIIGVAFSDTQLYTQEKAKHSGYDVNRHYRFWIDRIQAIENKTFSAADAAQIEYVLDRDSIRRSTLTTQTMRAVLKELKLSAYNDHSALLVVQHGGPSPPKLTFQENMRMTMLFNKIMDLYGTAVPKGGNRPYYPYFIYKLIEQEFGGGDGRPADRDKLRLLDYIHLQSRETVIKNDKIYQRICELAAADAGDDGEPLLRYRATERL